MVGKVSGIEGATIEICVPPELGARLKALARAMKRSESDVAGEAFASYVDLNERQMARIREALEEAETGAPGVPHEEVVKWLRTLGTENELPQPRAGKKR
jgi:predicted transcriptional regulator